MNKQVQKLRDSIQFHLPYRALKVLLRCCVGLTVLIFIAMIALFFVESEAIPYDQSDTSHRMYIDFQTMTPTIQDYYFVEDEEYIYIYFYDEKFDLSSSKRISGVPMLMDEEELNKLLPDFQKTYPDLEVETIEDMISFTGEYKLDGTITYPLWIITILLFVFIFMCFYLIFIKVYTYVVTHQFKKELSAIIENEEENRLIQELIAPMKRYDSLKVALLKDYLVCNHPSPYVMKYENISWIYIDKKPLWLGFDNNLRIMVYDQHYRRKKILFASGLLKKNRDEITELFEQLPLMNDQMIVGYNEENIQKFKEKKIGLR